MNKYISIIEKGASSEIKKDGYPLNKIGIKNWLEAKNIIKDSNELLEYRDIDVWKRGGDETYITRFEITIDSENTVHKKSILLKAIITIPPEDHLESWAKRRQLLQNNGIRVSNWYWYGEGIIIEDYYQYNYKKVKEFTNLIDIARTLDKLGFNTINFLRDILCNGEGVPHYVDFGFDLGEFSYFGQKVSLNTLMKTFPDKVQEIEFYLRNN